MRRKYDVQNLLDGIETPEDRNRDRMREAFEGRPARSHTPQPARLEFDVFLSHNSNDKSDVDRLNSELKKLGVKTWIDTEQLEFGDSVIDRLGEILNDCRSALVCIGPNGLGPWHDEEQKVLTKRRVTASKSDEKFRVITVLLPGGDESKIPAVLQNQRFADLRDEWSIETLDHLARSIRK